MILLMCVAVVTAATAQDEKGELEFNRQVIDNDSNSYVVQAVLFGAFFVVLARMLLVVAVFFRFMVAVLTFISLMMLHDVLIAFRISAMLRMRVTFLMLPVLHMIFVMLVFMAIVIPAIHFFAHGFRSLLILI